MTLKRTLASIGLPSGIGVVFIGMWAAREQLKLPFFITLPTQYNFLYPLPHNNTATHFVILFMGVLLVALFSTSLCSAKDASGENLVGRLPRGPWFSSRPRFALFVVSIALYLAFAYALSTQEYSHYFLIAFLLSIAGIAESFRNRQRGEKSCRTRLLDKEDGLFLIVIVGACLFLGSGNLLSWYFSSIGDEVSFFNMAKEIAKTPTYNIFNYSGVYGKFPIADSYFTAIFIWIFGPSVWAWKFSCVVIHATTASLIYVLGKLLYGRSVGVISALLLSCSHYFLAFDHIGYNNTHMCLTSVATMLVLLLSHRRSSRALLFLTGVASGLLSYSIWGGLITIPVMGVVLTLLCCKERSLRVAIDSAGIVFIGFLVAIIPGLLSNSLQDVKEIALNLNHGMSPLVDQRVDFWASLLTSIVAFFENRWWGSHYVLGPFLDPISGFLVLIGISLLIAKYSSWQSIVLLPWLVVGFLGIIFLSRSSVPYVTRLIFVLPPLTIVAARALSILTYRVSSVPANVCVTSVVLLAAALLNLQQLYLGTPLSSPQYEARLAVKELQNSKVDSVVYISAGSIPNQNIGNLLSMYSRPGISIVVTTEESIKSALENDTISEIFPRHSKLIAPKKLSHLLTSLMQSGDIPGPLSTVKAFPYGDDFVTANDSSLDYPVVSIDFMPPSIKHLLGLF